MLYVFRCVCVCGCESVRVFACIEVISSWRLWRWRFILLNHVMTAEPVQKFYWVTFGICAQTDLTSSNSPLSVVLSIWWKPMWLLPIRVRVSVIWMVTKWIWKTISNNIVFSLLFTFDCSVCMYVCAWCSCVGFISLQRRDKKIFLFLKTLCKYHWWKLTFVVRQVFMVTWNDEENNDIHD